MTTFYNALFYRKNKLMAYLRFRYCVCSLNIHKNVEQFCEVGVRFIKLSIVFFIRIVFLNYIVQV